MDDSGPAKAMKVVVILFLAVLLLGGGGAAAWFLYLAPSGEEETVAASYDPVFVELDGMMLPIIEEDQVVEQVTLKVTLTPDEDSRVTLGWVNTIADESLGTLGGKGRDSSFVLRVDLRF